MKIADRLKCLATLWFMCGPFGSSQKVQFGVQKENFGIIELVEELDDMFPAYCLMKQRFERNPEAIFSLPNLHKVMSGVKVEQNENGTLRTKHFNTMNAERRVFEEILRSTST